MHGSRAVFSVETAIRKLNSRFRRPPPKDSRCQWPVISATRPLFYFIRIFGLAPFEISEDHFIPGSCDVMYSLFCTLVHTYGLYIVLHKLAFVKKRGVLDITETAKVIFNYCVTLFNILVAVRTRKNFIGVLNIVKNFDLRVVDLGYPLKGEAAKIWVWSTGLCTAVLWITINRTGMYAFCESWVDNIAYILNYVATSLSTIKFSSAVLLIGQRFRHLNRIAQNSKESAMTNHKHIVMDYKVIQQLHDNLMDAGDSLSSQYEWSLLLWLMNLCVHSVSNLYFLINWLMSTPIWEVTRWGLVHCIVWWLVVFVAQLLLLHIVCHFTSDEANSMGSIVANWQPVEVSPNYRVEPSFQLLIRKLNFSAAGCFSVNLPLLSSITALLATYLVLLLQFQT